METIHEHSNNNINLEDEVTAVFSILIEYVS